MARLVAAPGHRVLGASEIAGAGEKLAGGKARRLAELAGSGLPVPPFFCVTTEVFDRVYAGLRPQLAEALRSAAGGDPAAIRAAGVAAAQRFSGASLGEADQLAILERFDRLFPEGARIAVRSSAVGEDSERDSFAGQLETYLYVRRDELCRRVLDCFASAFSERALAYRARKGMPLDEVRVAVAVQLMVEARAAGVMFTANPTTGDPGEAVISAALGLGEGVVDGSVESDTYYVDLASGRLRRSEIAAKANRVIFDDDRGAGTAIAGVPREEAGEPALDAAHISELTSLARAAAAGQSRPQDIEWALGAGGELYILQARPVTTLPRRPAGPPLVFDNANIVESHPGITVPLTFSFVRRGYEETFRQAGRDLGVPEQVLQEHRHVHANLVALIQGRMYYNLLNWYRLFTLVPGFEWALPAWEDALGLDKGQLPARAEPSAGDRVRTAPVVAGMIARMIRRYRELDRRVASYLALLETTRREFVGLDLDRLEAHALFELFERYSQRLSAPYAVAVVNDAFTQQLYEAVKRLIARYRLGDPDTLRNELFCGESGMDSVEPVRSLVSLAEEIRQSPPLSALFSGPLSDREIWDRLAGGADFARFFARLSDHLRDYGDRTLHELKFDSPLPEENPGFLIRMLRNYLATGKSVAEMEARERAIRERAERRVAAALGRSPLKRRAFAMALSAARKGCRHRENLRLARSRGYGIFKRITRALGRRFAEHRLLGDPGDILYLTVEEIEGAIRGGAVQTDLRALVAQRRREHRAFADMPPPPGRVVRNGVALWNEAPPEPAADPAEPPTEDGLLRGVGCSPGRARARAKVVRDPRDDLSIRGEILVAPMTDPGWVFLMVSAGGLVSERGSVLSHTAIIGRELGIPTVVGVKDALRRICDGDLIEVDGERGTVAVRREK